MMDLLFASKYPFTEQARELAKQKEIRITPGSLVHARDRVFKALTKGKLEKSAAYDDTSREQELTSYPIAKLIIAALKSRYFAGRYAVAESKRVKDYLQSDSDGNIEEVAEGLGINVTHDSPYSIPVQDYLRFCPKSAEYKLINKRLDAGQVHLSKNELLRVIEEAVRLSIEDSISNKPDDLPEEIKKAAASLRSELPKEEVFEGVVFLSEDEYPPCITALIERLRKSENLPHTARWYLATFLLNTGTKSEGVIKLFKTAPDYEERVTRYQVEYLANRKYSVPACSSVESYGLCVANCRVRHPLNYKKRVIVRAPVPNNSAASDQTSNAPTA